MALSIVWLARSHRLFLVSFFRTSRNSLSFELRATAFIAASNSPDRILGLWAEHQGGTTMTKWDERNCEPIEQ